MILRILLFISLVLLCPDLSAQQWISAYDRPEENGRWLCWEYSGKGQQAREITELRPLEYFTKQLADFDSEIGWRMANDKLQDWSKIHSQVNNVGMFAGQQVIDIFYYLPDDDKKAKAFGKMVVIGNKNQFRPIVWVLDDTDVDFSASAIKLVQGVSVLATRSRIDGSGNFYYEDYFTYDKKKEIPVNFRPDDSIQQAKRKLLPPGHGVWKGGGFDLEKMTYRQSVWKDGDSNCCPSGGEIELRLRFEENLIVVAKANYYPAVKTQ
ncbi:MAG: hypothetical protein ABI644_05995 [Arenimonas sp.]